MALYIGNPTNVVVSEAYKISFITYSAWMLLPTVACILIAYVVLRILFRGDYYLPRHINPPDADPKDVLVDPNGAIFGLVLLACCLCTLVGTSFASVPVWMVTLPFAAIMFVRDIQHDLGINISRLWKQRKPRSVANTTAKDHDDVSIKPTIHSSDDVIEMHTIRLPTPSVHTITSMPTEPFEVPLSALSVMQSTSFAASVQTKKEPKYFKWLFRGLRWSAKRFPTIYAVCLRMPWSILPFSLGMFILIEALAELGWIGIFATGMSVFTKNYVTAVFGMVFVSIIACQLLNNLVRVCTENDIFFCD